ncbi:hypothetical protein [Planifilum fimeticola]|uniref:hypothetical protein n=1 Tax=Planifilum fimeticola TaxID=201975 RepID=UPI0011B1F473|nr:hypothetical protein [Planifilum fimeticola]
MEMKVNFPSIRRWRSPPSSIKMERKGGAHGEGVKVEGSGHPITSHVERWNSSSPGGEGGGGEYGEENFSPSPPWRRWRSFRDGEVLYNMEVEMS